MILCIGFILQVRSQTNLVFDHSFEDTTFAACNGFGWGQYWVPVAGSPDYFNIVCGTTFFTGAPQNGFGYEMPRNGNGYAGVVNFVKSPPCTSSPEAREIFQGPLKEPLKAGKRYCIEYWVSVPDSIRYALNNMGAYVSDTSFNPFDSPNISFQIPFNRPLQLVNNGANNPLTSKNGWTKISGSFIAEGGEKFILIGNFYTYALSDTLFIGGPVPADGNLCQGAFSYYYIDDVSVYCCEEDSCEIAPSNISIYPNPNKGDFVVSYELPDKKNADFEIYDMLGRLVYKEILFYYEYARSFNLLSLRSGVYWCRIRLDDNELFASRIIIID